MSGVPNPPAFPSHSGDPEMTDPRNRVSCGGMTLRDYFAGQALAGLCSNMDFIQNAGRNAGAGEDVNSIISHSAYEFADAMLAARGAS